MNESLQEYISSQRSKGVSDEDISQSLISAGWQPGVIDSVMAPQPQSDKPPVAIVADTVPSPSPNQSVTPANSEQPKKPDTHLNASQVMLVIGLALVVVAAIVIVFRSWESYSPTERFLVVALPNVLLLAIGYFTKSKPNLAHIDEGTTAVGLLLLPVTFGTFYHHFNIYTPIDCWLFFLSTISSLPVLIGYDFWRRQKVIATLVIINLVAVVLFFGLNKAWDSRTWDVVGVVIGGLALGVAVFCERMNNENHLRPFQVLSAISFFFFAPQLVGDLLGINYLSGSGDSVIILTELAFISGILSLVLASSYYWLFKNRTTIEFQLQRFLQFSALSSLLIPLIVTISVGQSIMVTVPLAVSVGLILLAMAVGDNLIFVGGVLGIVSSLLVVIFKQFSNIQTPIFIFILGFVAIGLSIILSKLKLARQSLYNEQLANMLGIISDQKKEKLIVAKGHTQRLSILRVLILLFVVIPLVFGTLFLLFISFASR